MEKVKKFIPLERMETPTVKIEFKSKKTHKDCITVAIGSVILGRKTITLWCKSETISPFVISYMEEGNPNFTVRIEYWKRRKELGEVLNTVEISEIFEHLFDNFKTLFSE